jgi:hypothetical protein
VIVALQLLDEPQEGLLAVQFTPIIGLALFDVVCLVRPSVKGLLVDLVAAEPVVYRMDEVVLDGVFIDLATEGLHLCDHLLNGKGERGGQDGFRVDEMRVDFVFE